MGTVGPSGVHHISSDLTGGNRLRQGNRQIRRAAIACLFLSLLLVQAGRADDATEAIHNELRALRDGITEAFNKLGASGKEEDLGAVLQYVHKDVVLNAMNGDTSVGHDGIRQYFRKTMVGPNRTVQRIYHEFTVAALSTLHGDDTAIAYGSTLGRYSLIGGLDFEVNAIWLCTMVKEHGKWLVASFQFAPSIFDNPIANKLQRTVYWAGGIAAVIGIALGALLGRMSRRKKI